MKTLPIATALIAVLWSLAAYADMQGATPDGAVTPASGRVSPALQLPVNGVPPKACSSATLGTLALDPKAHLCLCDGNAWKLANLDEPSDWRAAR